MVERSPLLAAIHALAVAMLVAPPAEGAVVTGVWCQSSPLAIPDASSTGVTSTLTITTGVAFAHVNFLTAYVAIDHTYVSDLKIVLASPAATSRTLVDRPGLPCPEDDLAATFDDFAGPAANDMCDTTPRAIHGAVDPLQPFYLVTPLLLDGDWTLTVSDNATTDTGTLRSWCVLSGVLFYDGFESGDALEWSAAQN